MLDSFGFCGECRLEGGAGERREENQRAVAVIHVKDDSLLHRDGRGTTKNWLDSEYILSRYDLQND